jgi:hypothetical protein
MAARDHLNGEQLRMFIPAHELAQHTSADAIADYEYANDHYFSAGNKDEKVAYGPFSKTPTYKSKKEDLNNPHYSTNRYWHIARRTLASALDSEGIQDPVKLSFSVHEEFSGERNPKQPEAMITNGHHRIVYANEKNPNMEVPVIYEDSKYLW